MWTIKRPPQQAVTFGQARSAQTRQISSAQGSAEAVLGIRDSASDERCQSVLATEVTEDSERGEGENPALSFLSGFSELSVPSVANGRDVISPHCFPRGQAKSAPVPAAS